MKQNGNNTKIKKIMMWPLSDETELNGDLGFGTFG